MQSHQDKQLVTDLEETVTVLERTLANTQSNTGQSLGPALSRQLNIRRAELDSIRSRSQSVIVHTSTPNLSSNSNPPVFFEAENLSVAAPPAVEPPFQIYQDPPGAVASAVPKIVIVNTPSTAFTDKENQFPFCKMSDKEDDDPAEAYKDKMKELAIKLISLVELYDPDIYPVDVLRQNEAKWTKLIQECYTEMLSVIMDTDEADWMTENMKTNMMKDKDDSKKLVKDYNIKISQKLATATAVSSTQSSGAVSNTNTSSDAAQTRRAQVNADIEFERLTSDAKLLSNEVRKVEDWTKVDSHEVETAMQKIPDWRKRFQSIKESYFTMKRNVVSFNLPSENLATAEATINCLNSEMELCIDNLQFEDETRCLYSNSKSKTADVKYPSFGGSPEEDFLKFKVDMEDAFKSNRVRREDQLKKLRECLKSQPKIIIPESTRSIEDAFSILSHMYGDPSRLAKARKDKLLSLGSFPKPGSKSPSHLKQQMEWLLSVELLVKDLIELAEQDEDCYCEVYNPTMLRQLKSFFPLKNHEDMSKFQGSVKDKFSQLYDYIIELRECSQVILKDIDDIPASGAAAKDKKSTQNSTGSSGHGMVAKNSNSNAKFKNGTRYEKCRICTMLESQGDTDVYEDHFSSLVIGCPRLASMGTVERRKYVDLAQICRFCLDAQYVHRKGSKHVNCPVFQRPQNYTCKNSSCKEHYLVCVKHVAENHEKMEKNVKFWSDRGKVFTHVSVMSVSSLSEPDVADCPPVSSSPVNNVTCSRSLMEATERLKKMAKASKVRDLPKGEPMFLFSYIPGKTRDLTCFYDLGCSHCMIKSNVPVQQLDAVMTRKGPLMINAAADVSVEVQDEFMCLVPRADGSKQILLGVTCDKITSTFPYISTTEAVKEIMANVPAHKRSEMSNIKVPDMIGGDPDILLGVFYASCHPEVLHTLESGLFIAKLKLASTKGYTGVIGGPHASFAQLANYHGETVNLLSSFVTSIKNFHKFGPPRLPVPMFSYEDKMFAESMNRAELSVLGDIPEDDQDVDVVDEPVPFAMQCVKCGDDILESSVDILGEMKNLVGESHVIAVAAKVKEFEVDEKLHDLKTICKIMEQGISIEYRCPKCRQCHDCKNASDTERISVREEHEDEAIKDSVKIDFEAKKITARLPMRGDENQYLSNNRHIAVKVLENQCLKLKNDPDSKAVVIKAFKKLIDNHFAVKFDDLSDAQQEMINSKPVHYYLPWRVVHKESVTSPCRPVMDASSKTPLLPDGRGGRCLNDLTMKGKINTLDLLNMLLRFVIGPVACAGDLKAFYTSIALDEEQWHLQRVLWKEDLELDAEIQELIIITLIFGVRAVSALSERAVINLAHHVSKTNPRLAELLLQSRFVDDLADSDVDHESIKKLVDSADELFASVGLKCKGWSISGSPPHPDVTSDGQCLDVGGMSWMPEIDTVCVKIPPLHFGKKQRGKLSIGTQIFNGSFGDLNKFVPKDLTRRHVFSKFSSVFDLFGKNLPATAAMKVHLRKAVMETTEWDGVLTSETRSLWVNNFWRLHKLRGLQFARARIPVDAADGKMMLIAAVDAANDLKIAGIWARFLRKNGEYSSQHLIGRSLLAKENSSIPREELEAITIGSNLLWVVRKALESWCQDYMLISDSCIALCWVTSENKRLSLFHRNRTNQVRMNTDLSKLYFVRTNQNPADVATRSEKVQDSSMGPGSVWENGMPWMKGSLTAAIEADIIKPASELRVTDNEEKEYEKGLIFERTPEVIVQGHVVTEERVDKITERAEYSNYIFMPSKFNFRKTVIITSLVFKFIRLCKYKRLKSVENKFKMFPVAKYANICWGSVDAGAPDNKTGDVVKFDENDRNRALDYWYKKATAEVQMFNKADSVKRIGVMKDGILYCRSRIQDGQRLLQLGDYHVESLGEELGLSLMTPLIDRYSPIAYSIAKFIHENVAIHSGYETCVRMSLEYCHIIQGSSLFKQISEECVKCKMIRKKYLDCVMGPVSDHQLTISPAFHVTYLDLDGPYFTYVPGHERATRNKKVLSCKNYIMTFVCPVTKLCNLQVIEAKNAEAVMEGLTRLACEVGMPSCLVLDQETSFMKMCRDAEVNLQDLCHRGFKEFGVRFEVAPVQGHNYIGLAERKIKAVQECFNKMDLKSVRLHATGLQTFCKLIENHLNNIPLGYSFSRDLNNSPILKIISPNVMKIGRINSRCIDGPLRLPSGPKDFIKKVEDTYDAFFKIWNVAYLPKLIPTPKWFKDSPELKPNDIVYFQKVANEMSDSNKWTVGQVENVIRSKDGVVRRATIRYHNHGENVPRFTDRAVRSLVRLFSLEDSYFAEDMAEVEKRIAQFAHVPPIKIVRTESGNYQVDAAAHVSARAKTCDCCCVSQCSMFHVPGVAPPSSSILMSDVDVLHPDDEEDEPMYDATPLLSDVDDDVLMMMTSLETKFDLDLDSPPL